VNVADLLLARAADRTVGLRFDDQAWTFEEYVDEAIARAHLLLEHRPSDAPFHVGVLLENTPDYVFLLGAAALSGAVVVGINPTRRGAELERDIRHTECAVLVTEERFLPLLDTLDIGVEPSATFVVESARWKDAVAARRGRAAPRGEIAEAEPFLLIFTSGTSGSPKASICSQRRLADIAATIAKRRGITSDDVLYCAMPLFHANGMMSGWVAALAGGCTLALRRRFSASEFLPDVRRYEATLANYVGKVLAYVLATPATGDDADNTLRFVYGNEGTTLDLGRFADRFSCEVSDAYGSSEGGVTIFRVPGMPSAALGRGAPGTVVLDPETGRPCRRAEFGPDGRVVNSDEAVGEIARVGEDLDFEGYWNNAEAEADKVRDGIFWTGDLGYLDDDDFVYFVGRNADWLRVDGENIAAVTIESVVARFPGAGVVAAYAVPDPDVGDQVMVAMLMAEGASFDPGSFGRFLDEQPDLGSKAVPRFVRIVSALPVTASNKVLYRELRCDFWECPDQVWWRDGEGYRLLSDADIDDLRQRFVVRDRSHLLGAG